MLIRNGRIHDAIHETPFTADILVRDGKIAAVGDIPRDDSARMLDAAGLAVSPGFIDSHAHSDISFLEDDSGASKLYQGVTTEVTGQCGSSPFPAAPDYAAGFCMNVLDNRL